MALTLLADLWDDALAASLDEPEQLRYRSNLLGSDPRLTNFGGGNTSAKVLHPDPVTGEMVRILWVKGSGGDLGTIRRDGFATLYQDKLEALKGRYRGAALEDEMVELYPLCNFGANLRAPSIDTPLHAFVPAPHVDHLHPDWAIALAASANGPALLERLRAETGVHLVWLPWKRPGFELGLWLERAIAENPDCDGILLGSHGIFTWGETSRGCYESTLQVLDAIGRFVVPFVDAAGAGLFGGESVAPRADRRALARAVLPALRGQLGGTPLAHFRDDPEVLRFVGSARAAALAERGTSCPDHFVRTRVKPLFVAWDAVAGDADALKAAILAGLPGYRDDYARYYNSNKAPDSPAMRGADPTVVLIPGVGMLSFGKNKAEARITGEFYVNAIHVMEGATAMGPTAPADASIPADLVCDNYVSLPQSEAFGIEYWQLEEAKLKRMPPEKELARKVCLIVGAGPGIGMASARRLLADGAHLFLTDRNAALAASSAAELANGFGADSVGHAQVDVTSRESLRAALGEAVLRFGGVDVAAVLAAVHFPPDDAGQITDAQTRATIDVNLVGSLFAAEETAAVMAEQGTSGSIILISSANAVVAKKASLAYDTSKAAVNHLVREMAVTYAPKVRVNGVAPATVVAGSQMFPKERVLASLAKYHLPGDPDEEDAVLRERLADFYAQRTLLKGRVNPADIAEAIFLLASPRRLPLTTGQILPVDAGLTEAFLR